jgi:hypothetical protein
MLWESDVNSQVDKVPKEKYLTCTFYRCRKRREEFKGQFCHAEAALL